jgi:hypothetical protein
MANWLVMFRPETYALVLQHGQIGVRAAHSARFRALSPGDRFVVYVSRDRILDGWGEVTGEPFASDAPLFGPGLDYPNRCPVRIVEQGHRRPVGDALWYLETYSDLESTTPVNMLMCRGGFQEITDRDFDFLKSVMEGRPVLPVGNH